MGLPQPWAPPSGPPSISGERSFLLSFKIKLLTVRSPVAGCFSAVFLQHWGKQNWPRSPVSSNGELPFTSSRRHGTSLHFSKPPLRFSKTGIRDSASLPRLLVESTGPWARSSGYRLSTCSGGVWRLSCVALGHEPLPVPIPLSSCQSQNPAPAILSGRDSLWPGRVAPLLPDAPGLLSTVHSKPALQHSPVPGAVLSHDDMAAKHSPSPKCPSPWRWLAGGETQRHPAPLRGGGCLHSAPVSREEAPPRTTPGTAGSPGAVYGTFHAGKPPLPRAPRSPLRRQVLTYNHDQIHMQPSPPPQNHA